MPFEADPIRLTKQQRMDLNEIARSLSLPAGFVLRAKIILLLANRSSYNTIKAKLDTPPPPSHAGRNASSRPVSTDWKRSGPASRPTSSRLVCAPGF